MRFCDIFCTYRHPRTMHWAYKHKKTGAIVSPWFRYRWHRAQWIKDNKTNLLLEEMVLT